MRKTYGILIDLIASPARNDMVQFGSEEFWHPHTNPNKIIET